MSANPAEWLWSWDPTPGIVSVHADQYGRGAGVNALALLAAWGETPREPVIEKLQWLAREGLEREYSAVWDSLASAIVDLEAVDVFPELRRAFDTDRLLIGPSGRAAGVHAVP